jgi:hypothetical protein
MVHDSTDFYFPLFHLKAWQLRCQRKARQESQDGDDEGEKHPGVSAAE